MDGGICNAQPNKKNWSRGVQSPGRQVARENEFSTLKTNNFWSSLWFLFMLDSRTWDLKVDPGILKLFIAVLRLFNSVSLLLVSRLN